MSAPKLLYAAANGQTAVRAIFDQPMRRLGQAASEDPANPANWTSGGGLPAVVSVLVHSPVEFELLLASPAPVAVGYSVTVSAAVQSGVDAAPMDPAFLSYTFSVTTPDLTVLSALWTAPDELSVTFSEPLDPIGIPTSYRQLATIVPQDPGARQLVIAGAALSGAVLQLTVEDPGTAGARYQLRLVRETFVASASSNLLRAGEETKTVWGQGQAPSTASLALTEAALSATSTEVLGETGWPLAAGLYSLSEGSLSDLQLGGTPSELEASVNLTLGNSVSFGPATSTRTLAAGASWLAQATSVIGAGSQTLGVGTTTFTKAAGAPYEIALSGAPDAYVRSGRRLTTTLAVSFTPSVTVYSLVAFTWLNTQVSVLLEKTATNEGIIRVYRGQAAVAESLPFDPTVPFTLEVIDAVAEEAFLAVRVNGEVVVGAPASSLDDSNLWSIGAGATALALTLGTPLVPAATFSVTFSASLEARAFVSTGLLGLESRDLFSLAAPASAVVTAAPSPASAGYAATGQEALNVRAVYVAQADAVQVIIGLNDAVPAAFTGTVSLMTGQQQVMDVAVFDQSYRLVGSPEITVVFLHPRCWAGLLVGVTLTLDGDDYTALVPVYRIEDGSIIGSLAQQPATWAYPRLQLSAADGLGPAVVFSTP